jgi:outer membrane protein TolC
MNERLYEMNRALWRILYLSITACFLVTVASGGFSPAASETLSLREAVRIAIKSNPDIGIATQGLKMADKDLLGDYGQLLPNFSVSMSAGHVYYGPSSVQFDAQGRPVQQSGFDYPSYSIGMSSGLTIFNGGRNINNVRSSLRNRDAATEELRYRKDLVTESVIRAYYYLVRAKMLTVVAQESVEQAAQNLERTEALLEVGSATRAAVLQAKVAHSNTQLDLIKTTNAIELARADLLNVLNVREEDLPGDVDTSLVIDFIEPMAGEEVRYAMEHRADLKSLDYSLEAANHQVSSAKSGWYPSIGAQFNYGWSSREIADNFNFFKEEYYWSIGAGLQFNIFDRFLTSSNVGIAKANFRIAEYNLEKARLNAEKEIKQIIIIIYEAAETMEVAEETVEQTQEDLRLAEERYRVGAGTMLDILTAQVNMTQAKANVIDAKVSYLIAVAELYRATGRVVYDDL